MYEYSTKLDAEKHGGSGLARIIPAAEGAELIRIHPLNSRSILGLQKKMAQMQTIAQSSVQMLMQILVQNFVQKHMQIFVQ